MASPPRSATSERPAEGFATPPVPPLTLADEYAPRSATDSDVGTFFDVANFALESGLVMPQVQVSYRSWGLLNAERDNALLVPHALTGNADIDTWWGALLGPGRCFDTDRYFVVGVNMLGSCYGTTSPLDELPEAGVAWSAPRAGTHAEAAGTRYAADFPYVTVRDNVHLQHRLLSEHLGVRRLHAVVGGSAGGMQALEWLLMYPDYVERAALLACSAVQAAWQIAVSEAQRQSIYRDPHWNGGFYSLQAPPADGLAVARQNAMVWYRSAEAYSQKFGRKHQPPTPGSPSARAIASSGGGGRGAPDSYAVEGYLDHQGVKFVERFDANCYVVLTRTLDSHDITRDRGGASVSSLLSSIHHPVVVIGITSDVLYPLAMQRELAGGMRRATLHVLDSPQGHDAFLLESRLVGDLVTALLASDCDRSDTPPAAPSSSPSSSPTTHGAAAPSQASLPSRAAESSPPPLTKHLGMNGLPFLMPTPAVLRRITAEAAAKRRAAQIEGLRSAGCLTAVAW